MNVFAHYHNRGQFLFMTDPLRKPRIRRARQPIRAARHESALLINPLDARHIVGVEAALGAEGVAQANVRISLDGGKSWRESERVMLPSGCSGVTSPVLAMDAQGTLHLVLLALNSSRQVAGVATYRSDAAGLRWSSPAMLFENAGECACSLAADLNAGSPFRGSVYLVTDAGERLCFARCANGSDWVGSRGGAPGAFWPGLCASPDVLVDGGGGVHMFWTTGSYERSILAAHSNDGGDTFGDPALVAEAVVDTCDFVTETVPASVITADGGAVCAWADFREGRARIYYRRSLDYGRNWIGAACGEPLLEDSPASQHEFQPHLLVTPNGEICCAYYQYGPKAGGGTSKVDLVMAVSYDRGASFKHLMVLSEQPWDPAVDEPLSRAATRGALSGIGLG